MNNKRRELLRKALISLDAAEGQISTALDEEQECIDNMPENLEDSERHEKMELTIEYLEDALSGLDEVRNNIEHAKE
jgi:hypothetical protein